MTLKHWAWLTGLAAALAATSAYSQHREAGDVYLGAALGYNIAPNLENERQKDADELADENEELLGIDYMTDVSVDDGVFGWGAYGGYFITDSLVLEFGYLDNADMEADHIHTVAGVESESDRYDISTSVLYSTLVAYIPMSDGAAAFPFVKGGLARWEMEWSFEGEGGARSVDSDGNDLLLGAGVDVPVNEDASIRGEWMMLLIGDDNGGTQHRFQVGLNFAF